MKRTSRRQMTDQLRAVAELQHPGAGLEEERAEEKEVVAAVERDLDARPPGQVPVEMTGGGEATDPPPSTTMRLPTSSAAGP